MTLIDTSSIGEKIILHMRGAFNISIYRYSLDAKKLVEIFPREQFTDFHDALGAYRLSDKVKRASRKLLGLITDLCKSYVENEVYE